MEKKTFEDIDIYRFESGISGPNVTISGAVHGNEKSGTKALTRLLGLFESGQTHLEKGSLTILPKVNPRAYDENVRFIDYNLNRSMYRRAQEEIIHYEDRLRNVVCPVLEQTDYLLDLHSCTAKSDAFMIVSGDITHPDNLALAKSVGASRLIWGWQDVVEASNANSDPRHAYGMTEYTREHGGQGMTIECGNHDHPLGPAFAFQAACNLLQGLGVAEIMPEFQQPEVFAADKISIRLKQSVFKVREGALCEEWSNMQSIAEGTPIARFDNGKTIHMPQDGYIVMPNKNAGINAEWFYWGVKESIPSL